MKRILFVDDEPRILEGLRNQLRRQRRNWDMVFAEGGRNAIDEMSKAPFDVVVTDMRMPGIDGAKLLERVQEDHPNMVRIVLTGYTEYESVLRAIPVAHQVITKPCKPGDLENIVERACDLQQLVGDDIVRKMLGGIEKLPPIPRMYTQLTELIAGGEAGARDVAKVLEQDMAMSAKVLQLVNSSFFGTGNPVTSVEFAVVRLGLQTIRNLTLSLELFDTGRPPRVRGFSLEGLQRHALLTASISQSMVTDKRQADAVFMAAMLHDVGKLVLATELPDTLRQAITTADAGGIPLHEAEARLNGITHAEIGAYLLGLWGLPCPVVEAVANHHEPGRVQSREIDTLTLVHVANGLAHEVEGHACARAAGWFDEEYLAHVGVDAKQMNAWRSTAARRAKAA